MNTSDIYQKISQNIIQQFQSIKKGDINAKTLNENLILNLSSMCKFLSGKDNINSSCLDVYVPMSRFEYSVSNKIRGKGEEDNFNMSVLIGMEDKERARKLENTNNYDEINLIGEKGFYFGNDNYNYNDNESLFS